MQLYAITDGTSGREPADRLIEQAVRWAAGGVDFIQIREKHLSPAVLRGLTKAIVAAVRKQNSNTRVLLNGAAELAREAGADGIHLAGERLHEIDAVRLRLPGATLSVACHSAEEITQAHEARATMALFAPVFEKPLPGGRLAGHGLEELQAACAVADGMPVYALGGITVANARLCMEAGATGVAGIRLFAGEEWLLLR